MDPLPLDRIRAQHFELRRRCEQARELFASLPEPPEDPERLNEVVRHLEELAQALAEHFALEEAGGYFSEVIEAVPALKRQADRLQSGHVRFRQECTELLQLVRNLSTNSNGWYQLRVRVAELLGELEVHEAAENELVREAFMEDGSSGA